MMKPWLASLAATLLVACGGNVRSVEAVRYDFGSLPGAWSGAPVPIAALEVQAASWLADPAMHFRLAYSEPLRRQSYADSRWAAPPAELLEGFLKRRIVFGQPDFSGRGCRLHMFLHELEQRFDDPQSSKLVLEAQAALMPARGGEILSKRAFLINKAAPAPVARGGAAAAGEAAQALAGELGGWLAELSRDKPALAERCRAN